MMRRAYTQACRWARGSTGARPRVARQDRWRNSHTQSAVGGDGWRVDDYYASRGAHGADPVDILKERGAPVVWSEPATGQAESRHMLSEAQLQAYRQQGFILLPKLFSQEELQPFVDAADAERRRVEEDTSLNSGDEGVHFILEKDEKVRVMRSLFAPHTHHALLSRLTTDERLVRKAEQILADQVYMHQSRLNFQRALHGSGFTWHSDFESWHAEDGVPLPRMCSVVVMLSPNQTWNGALCVIPGSHQTFVACHAAGPTPKKHWELSLQYQQVGTPSLQTLRHLMSGRGPELDHGNGHHAGAAPNQGERGIVQLCGDAGDAFIFDCNLLHSSPSNVSPLDRMNLFCVYNAVSNAAGPPFCGDRPRPEHIAARDPAVLGVPVTPTRLID